jgi:peptidyl-prolyl cis-trans isomerase B (cyclophilin B)
MLIAAILGAIALVAVGGAFVLGWFPPSAPSASPTRTAAPRSSIDLSRVHPPSATPLASPPAQPAGDGTTATIETDLGTFKMELFTQSAPVASENFINLAEAGFYNGLVFHRLVPDFVIQGGDPDGDGSGGPGYDISDEPVVGEYSRGIVAMARTSEPNSAGSQFFIVLSDQAHDALESFRTYVIFGRVVEGMDVVDAIAATPNSGSPDNTALDPVAMNEVTIDRP